MCVKDFHPGKLSFYATLSVVDFFLTYHLVQQGGGHVYEGNPIAHAWLSDYGWPGLLFFKMIAVLLVGSVCVYISYHRPRLGGYILMFACLAVTVVVVYSCSLAGFVDWQPYPKVRWSRGRGREVAILCHRFMMGVVDDRYSLDDAIAELAKSAEVQNSDWLKARLLASYPNSDFEQALAAFAIRVTVRSTQRDDPAEVERIRGRLESAFEATFQKPLPPLPENEQGFHQAPLSNTHVGFREQ